VAVAKDQSEDSTNESDDIVVLTKAKIQATLEEAASVGRLTASAASEILAELLAIAQRQTDSFLSELSDQAPRGPERRPAPPDPGVRAQARQPQVAARHAGQSAGLARP
jgi:hypothetical protein